MIAQSALQNQFLALLPAIETHGNSYFRYLKCPHRKADALQEMRALAWKWLVRLVQRGKDINEFLATFNTFLGKAVISGRRLAGMLNAKDVMCHLNQKRNGFTVESLPSSPRMNHETLYGLPHGQQGQDAFEERLQDNTITPVPDQVQFRLDFPAWMKTLTGRERRIIRAMARNEQTKDLSREFDLSPGRISQLRQEFRQDWNRFCDGPVQSEVA
jgi:hypothetical protein